MATLADSLVSSSARKLPIRKRPDLSARLHRYQGRAYWVVKEPIGLNYFRFQEEEYAILCLLDGDVSLDEVKDRFEAAFPPQKITVEELQQFIGMLHRSGLVVTGAPGQGKQLKKRGDERWRKELLSKFTNLLAVRFKGVDPERFLNWLTPKFRFCFSRLGVATWLIVCLSALLLVMVQFDVFRSKLPAFHQFFGPQNWFYLGLALGATKIIHEFGHGVTCKHFGGECHEIGIMFLVLTPCLYCNVSDSWMLPSKWRRAMIGAGGMYVELFLASIATFIWWFTEPGLLNNLCLSTMFVSSVSTVMFNANPLLRYDGYYILSDIVEIPNLRQKSTKILSTKLGKWCLGLDEPEDPFLPKRNQAFFIAYTIAAVFYRWFVLFSILFFLFKVFEPYGLKPIGYAIGSVSIVGLVVMPLWKVGKFFYIPGRIDRVKKKRMFATIALLLAVLAAIVYVPLPYHVLAAVHVQPVDAKPVWLLYDGKLTHDPEHLRVKPGDHVEQGDVLAVLQNDEIEHQVLQLETERGLTLTRLQSLQLQQFTDPNASLEIQEVKAALAGVESQLKEKLQERERLTLVAPRSGIVIPPAPEAARSRVEGGLPSMSGTPFDAKNDGAILLRGQEFCTIGDPAHWEAMLVIEQSDVGMVLPEQNVKLRLDQLPLENVETSLKEKWSQPMSVAPMNLSNKSGGPIATETDRQSGKEKPQTPHFVAMSHQLDDSYANLMRSGLRGEAKVTVAPKTIGQRFWRFVTQTFNFEL